MQASRSPFPRRRPSSASTDCEGVDGELSATCKIITIETGAQGQPLRHCTSEVTRRHYLPNNGYISDSTNTDTTAPESYTTTTTGTVARSAYDRSAFASEWCAREHVGVAVLRMKMPVSRMYSKRRHVCGRKLSTATPLERMYARKNTSAPLQALALSWESAKSGALATRAINSARAPQLDHALTSSSLRSIFEAPWHSVARVHAHALCQQSAR